MSQDNIDRAFAARSYFEAFRTFYPEVASSSGFPVPQLNHWEKHEHLASYAGRKRYVPMRERSFAVNQNVWNASRPSDASSLDAARGYAGLLNLKSPFDLVLYSNLIWELQPATILEFGCLQGGSTLWFAHQLDALCPTGAIHAFERYDRCIHERARHPRTTFHAVDLMEPLDGALLASLPHPWLVIDDAHVNVRGLTLQLSEYLKLGDYYIWEDVLLRGWSTHAGISKAIEITELCDLCVDIKYTDAFGTNVTAAPNAWFRRCK